MGKIGKNLASLLRKTALVSSIALPLTFASCEKPDEPIVEPPKDTTPPKITISSPIKNKVYDVNEISFSWNIEEANPKNFWCSTDNGSRISIAQSGTENKYFENGNHKIVVGGGDLFGNASKDSVLFTADKHTLEDTINLFVQPNDSTLNWYGSGDVNKNNILNSGDLTRFDEVVAGTYSNPSDTRLKDRADVNGNGVLDNEDRQLLEGKLNGSISHLPAYWNELNKEEKISWLTKMFAIDKTDKSGFPPNSCALYEYKVMIQFHGYGDQKDISRILALYPFDFSYNCRLNLPVLNLDIVAYDENGKPGLGHGANTIILGDELGDRCDIEPENDSLNINILKYNPSFTANSKIWIRGPPTIEMGGGIASTDYLIYEIKNGVSTLIYTNPKLITKREK